jgi:protein HIRA/HIR1
MKFIVEKPSWPTSLIQELHPIYTLDFHPDGTRFAFALFKDGYIFNTRKLLEPSSMESSERVPLSNVVDLEVIKVNPQLELLAKLDNHMMAINCIRFSPNGKYVSCASDDQKVSLYQYEYGAPAFGGGKDGTEKWRCVKLFGGHTRDVLAVDWSPDSRFLVSCGVDNTICVHDVEKKTLVTTLSMDGIVKGVVWDPIGKYIISQGDKSAIVWAVNTWTQIAEVTEPYALSHGNNMFYRPTWSPDGDFIVTGNGIFQKRHVAPILSRKDFSHTNEFSGHKDVVVVARYNPIVYQDPKNDKGMVTVVALGSTDNSVTIWATNAGKPLFYASDVVKQGVTDIAWSREGNHIVLASSDGSLTVIHFPEGFFGIPMTQSKVKALMKEKYGDMSVRTLLEAPIMDQLDLNAPDEFGSQQVYIEPVVSAQPVQDTDTVMKNQKETVTKQGKRRITPLVSNIVASIPVPQFSPPQPAFQKSRNQDILESRMTEGSNVLESTSQFSSIREPQQNQQPVAAPTNIQVVAKKRSRPEELTSVPKRVRRESTAHSQFVPEDLYIKISDTDELKCSVAGEVQYMVNNVLSWNATIGEAPANAAANNNFVAIATHYNSLHLFSKSGRRLLPPIILDSLPQHICCNKDRHLVIMTSEKMVYLWDVLKLKCVLQCSADQVVHRVPHQTKFVDDLGLSITGVPVITLNTGESYLYSEDMKSWLCVADSHAPLSSFVSSASHLYDNATSDEIYESITYRYLKTRASRAAEQRRIQNIGKDGNTETNQMSLQTIEDLEISLASTAVLSDSQGYLQYLQAYVHHLARTNNADRLRDLCDSLLGPVYKSTDWEPNIAGIPKRNLLSKVLTWVGRNLSLQRITIEYRDMLDKVLQK